ncbi:hypothetical protein HHK36_020214 [Tetracentron sinense]|uniref:Reverse transcriptase Ty1/copia-type domain-containing protein n=1 Tax=Tetracentron sinense TaxID=13715 RepID=A0A834YZ58_TETSI|nr:hypothetical protein HHK36_020214 [Tetracentron sinense]
MLGHFEMTDMGLMSYFLGIEVVQTSDGIFISQKKYANDILKKFKIESCKPILTSVEERLKLVEDSTGVPVDSTNFRSEKIVYNSTDEDIDQLNAQCYDMEEILDEFTLRLEQQYQRQGIVGFLYKSVNFVTNLKLRHNLATKIQAIKKSIVEVSARRQRYGLNCLEQTSNSNSKIDTMHDLRQNALLFEEAELVGINEPREKLIRCLVEGKSRLEVVSDIFNGGIISCGRTNNNDDIE